MGKSSCCCGATPSKPCLCMKQDVMSCSAKAPMCPCYKALAEKKGAESKKNCGCGQDPCKTYGAESFATEGKSFVCDACEETLPLKLRNRSKKVAQEFGMGMGDICRPCVKRIKSYEEDAESFNADERKFVQLVVEYNLPGDPEYITDLLTDANMKIIEMKDYYAAESFSADTEYTAIQRFNQFIGEVKDYGPDADNFLIRFDHKRYAPVVDSQGYDTGADPATDWWSVYPNGYDDIEVLNLSTLLERMPDILTHDLFYYNYNISFNYQDRIIYIKEDGKIVITYQMANGMYHSLRKNAETHAYSYAYNDGHSDSRKGDEYRPNLSGSRQEADFKKILKQKAEGFEDQLDHVPALAKIYCSNCKKESPDYHYSCINCGSLNTDAGAPEQSHMTHGHWISRDTFPELYDAEYSRDSDGRFSSKSAISFTTAAIIGLAGAYFWSGKK